MTDQHVENSSLNLDIKNISLEEEVQAQRMIKVWLKLEWFWIWKDFSTKIS